MQIFHQGEEGTSAVSGTDSRVFFLLVVPVTFISSIGTFPRSASASTLLIAATISMPVARSSEESNVLRRSRISSAERLSSCPSSHAVGFPSASVKDQSTIQRAARVRLYCFWSSPFAPQALLSSNASP